MLKIVSIALLFAISLSTQSIAEELKSTGTVDVYFSPKGGTTEAVVNQIDKARSEILVQAYSFTSTPIAKALVNAHKRGVNIKVVLDKSQRKEKYTSADFIAHAGIPTYIDSLHAIAHNKIIIIDKSTLITGSFNFTSAAENKNAENLLVIKDNPKLTIQYILNYDEHKGHSTPYVR